jgi:hypothetical protein
MIQPDGKGSDFYQSQLTEVGKLRSDLWWFDGDRNIPLKNGSAKSKADITGRKS